MKKFRVLVLLCTFLLTVGLVACVKNSEVGTVNIDEIETVTFGTFEDEPIVWDVIESDEDSQILISHNVLTHKEYNSEQVAMNWEDSEIREWLNGEFYTTSFTEDEQFKIQTVTNPNLDYEEYFKKYCRHGKDCEENPNACGDTKDKVFLLSWEEVIKYYGIERGKMNEKSINAVATYTDGKNSNWWLRSTGCEDGDTFAMAVFFDGEIGGYDVYADKGVRPVICISK